MLKVLAVLSLLLSISNVFGQSKPLLGPKKNLFRIQNILVRGTRKVEPEAIYEKIAARKGMMLDNYLLAEDIKRIYELKHFEYVEAHREKIDGKTTLVFEVREKPIIKQIKIEGNEELDEDEIKEKLKSKEFTILDVNTLKNDIVSLQDLYEEKGFFLANVDYEIDRLDNENVLLKFKINEFDKVQVKKITFLGNERFSDKEIKSIMFTREEDALSFFNGSGNFKEFNFKTDLERIKFFYQTKGHLQVNVSSPEVTVSPDKKWIFITIKVIEGPEFTVNDIFFNGEVLFSEEELFEKLTLKPEMSYAEDKLREDVKKLTELYQDEGYAFANVLRNIEIVPGETKVNIRYSFEKGDIAYFGKITVKGNNRTRDKVVRRELRIYEGMKYSGSKLRFSKENVNRLGFFEPNSVIFNTIPSDENPNILDVEIQLKERNTGQISLGAGYSTANGGFIQGSIAQNNFRGLGQNLRLNFSQARNVSNLSLSFTEPYLFDSLWTAGFDVFRNTNDIRADQEFERRGFDIRLGHPITDFTRGFITYRFVDTNVEEFIDSTLDADTENGIASVIDGSIVTDTRNNRFEPSKGYFLSFSTEYAGLGFDQKWIKSTIDARYYNNIVGDLVLRYRFNTGRVFRNGNSIPRNTKFFLGGPRNLRGYGLQEISPTQDGVNTVTGDPQTFNVGGLSQLFTTLEFEHPLIREAGIKWVVFADAGNVFREYFGADGTFLYYDYGFGFRWFSPIGVLRFEFGYPINPDENDESSQFFFDIGQLF